MAAGADADGARARVERGEVLGHGLDHRVVLDVARGRHHDVGRPVPLGEEAGDVVAPHGLDGVDRAGHLAPERVVGEQRLVAEGVHALLGLVLLEGDLLEDDLALGVDVGLAQRGCGEHVAEHAEREVE